MPKPKVLQILISSAALGGLVIIWFDFNVKVFKTMLNVTNRTLFDTAAERRIKETEEEIRRIEEEKEEEKEEAIRRIEEEKEEEIRRIKEE